MILAFDLDGTLEDSRDDMVAAIQRVRMQLGLSSRTDAQLRPWVSKGMPKLYANAFDDFLSTTPKGLPELVALYEDDYSRHVADTTRLYSGIKSALITLSKDHRLVLVTNKPEAISRLLLDALDIGHVFAAVVGGDSFEKAKPSPMMLDGALSRIGSVASPLIMIGDSPGDIRMAQAHGSPCVWCAWGYYERPGPVAPTATANTPEELVSIVKSFAIPAH